MFKGQPHPHPPPTRLRFPLTADPCFALRIAGKIYSGLVVVEYFLADEPVGTGGLAIVPVRTHRSDPCLTHPGWVLASKPSAS